MASTGSGSPVVGVGKVSGGGAVTTMLAEFPLFCTSASLVLRILSVMAFKLGIFL